MSEAPQSLFLILIISGVVGGFGHCVGMCGPIMLFFGSIIEGLSLGQRLLAYFAYHLGRASSYAFMGGMIAFLGSFLIGAKYLEPLQKLVLLFVSALLIIIGIFTLLKKKPVFLKVLFKAEAISLRMANLLKSGGIAYFFPVGILNGFLPCGLSYAGLITTSALGLKESIPFLAFLKGFIAMFLFGLATIPSMVLITEAGFRGKLYLQEKFNYIAGFLMIIAGIYFIWTEFFKN